MAHYQPSAYLTWPTTFQPIPAPLPSTVPPPFDEHTFRAPFNINKDLYNFALQPQLPLAFASVYVVTVFALNAYNRNRDNKPWAISKWSAFGYFVVVHNVVLALYSFATFAGMARAISHTWPGLDNLNGAAGVADALCKLHGPRGLGDAATFNTTINIWEVKNTAIKLLPSGNPDPADVGRLWNEGLAFWGWIFYVSKFYEVIDTLIILAKGKRSATLQTYHHAGAMLCMWAGIRFMSPPIWMFVFINSAIHAMMYTYFTASALGIKVPQGLKRTLTSLQIAQFVFGASYAAAHLFVAYDIPIRTPYQVVSAVERAVSSASSAASGVTSTVSEIVENPTVTASIGSLVKKLLLRAAGEEGVAERVAMSKPDVSAYAPSVAQMEQKLEKVWERRFETHYRSEWARVNCIDTTGEAFAIYLNLLYLAPLTWLFGRFFVRAYTARGRNAKARSASAAAQVAADVAREAKRGTEQSFEKGGMEAEDELARRSSQGKEKGEELYEQLRKDVKSMKDGTFRDRRVSERVQSYEGKVKTAAEKARESVKSMTNGSGSRTPTKNGSDKKNGDSAIVDDAPAVAASTNDQQGQKQSEKVSTESSKSEKAAGGGSSKSTEKQEKKSPTETGSEPADKQEKTLAESEATRPAPEEPAAEDQQSVKPAQEESTTKGAGNEDDSNPAAQEGSGEDRLYSEVVSGEPPSDAGAEDDDKENHAPSTSKENPSNATAEDDTDAMGRSGVGIESSDAAAGTESTSTETQSAET